MIRLLFQLLEEIAAKEEEEVNKKPKEKDEKEEKTKKDKGKGDEEVLFTFHRLRGMVSHQSLHS